MSLFDRLRPKWKHPDPVIREAAVRDLSDQDVLESVANCDPEESVQLAAVAALTDQDALARLARGKTTLAVPAMKRLSDTALVKWVALTAESRVVRELAIEQIDDPVTLHRIATSDTDASVRLKARIKRLGPDQARDYIRNELSKLQLAQQKAADIAGFCGSLDDVSNALIGDQRFHINGGIELPEPRVATIRELDLAPATGATVSTDVSGVSIPCAQFLAFKRGASGEPEEVATANAFFEIRVWRTDKDTYLCHAEEKRLKVVPNAVEWSRVSNETPSPALVSRDTQRSKAGAREVGGN